MKINELSIPTGTIELFGTLRVPESADSLVIFAHGSGSSRFSARNNHVAKLLNDEKIATLLLDLLTESENNDIENRFDIEFLTERLIGVTQYVQQLREVKNLKIGYFGASTGAASALKAAAYFGKEIKAIVSRGGRPDLAKSSLPLVQAPTLLIVGSLDQEVIELNERAYSLLTCEKKIEIVKGASHLFEEPGKLDDVAALAINWFKKHIDAPKIKEYVV